LRSHLPTASKGCLGKRVYLFLHAAWRAKTIGNEEQLLAIRALMSVFGSLRFD
jgi:hypothetical protein